ncbi:hypothetical protein ACH5RR_015037 [Cinchona calisaya]|uniref:Uncharacterized protein n=1 Tax=Cinchona calisaya TaxID=153742 RepID=A0ABD2ZT65_9GENT
MASEFIWLGPTSTSNPERRETQIQWIRPAANWAKLKTNDSIFSNPAMEGAGGLIRNFEGSWLERFARNLELLHVLLLNVTQEQV